MFDLDCGVPGLNPLIYAGAKAAPRKQTVFSYKEIAAQINKKGEMFSGTMLPDITDNMPEDTNKVKNAAEETQISEKNTDNRKIEDKKTSSAPTSNPFIKEVLSWVMTIALAVAIAFVLSHVVVASVQVPTGSMLNTIQLGDRIIGSRLTYKFSDPERGDIIIFYAPDEEDTLYIKRCIGLPGDKVVIKDAKIYINDSETPLEEDYLPEEWVENAGPYEFEVPEDCYLMLGDNRNDSWDARCWTNTYVTRDKIVAKAEFIYFPFKDAKTLW